MLIVFNLTEFPNEFLELIRKSHLNIFGVSIGGEISKIGRDFRYGNVTKNLKRVTNIGSFARKRKVVSNCVVKLKI